MLISLQTLQSQEEELEALHKRAKKCQSVLTDEEIDGDRQLLDEEAYLELEVSLDEAQKLCQELIVCKTAACLSSEIQESIDQVEQLVRDNPDKCYIAEHGDIRKLLDEMAEIIRCSTLALDHPLREAVKNHKLNLAALRATAPEVKPQVIVRGEERDHDLPKTTIKKFNGGLAEWHVFWGRFNGAVHTNDNIKEHKKLALLIDLVTDPALHDYMITANDGQPGRYQQAVDYLTSRFNKPRELHSFFCNKISSLQPIKGTSAELSAVADAVYSAVSGIRRSGFTSIDEVATSLAVPISPDDIRQQWEQRTEKNKNVPNIDEWVEFVRQKAAQADKCQKPATIEVSSFSSSKRAPREYKKEKTYKKPYIKNEGKVYVANSQPAAEGDSPQPKVRGSGAKNTTHSCKITCGLCQQLHYVFSCKNFLDMSVAQRKGHVQSASLCSNCLRPGHATGNCNSTFKCRICKGSHNTLLHVDPVAVQVNAATASDHTLIPKKEGLLMTSRVRLTGPAGHTAEVTALLDSGAGVSVLSKRVMKSLQLQALDEWLTLTGIETPDHPTARPTAWVKVSSLDQQWSREVKVTVLPRVTADLPRQHLQSVRDLPHLKSLTPLADSLFHVPKRVDLLLDVDVFDDILLPEKISGPIDTPSAWKTTLGWGVMGRYSPEVLSQCSAVSVNVASVGSEEIGLNSQLERFWIQEEIGRKRQILSQLEIEIQEHFSRTHQYSKAEKRYVVTLPRKKTALRLGESRAKAEQRFLRNEQSLLRKGTWKQFQDVIQEYITLGHTQLVTKPEMSVPVHESYYLPRCMLFSSIPAQVQN